MDANETHSDPEEAPDPQQPAPSPPSVAAASPPSSPSPQDGSAAHPHTGSHSTEGVCPCSGAATPEGAGKYGGNDSQYVYAVGRIEARIPSLSVEKEIAQAMGRAETVDLTDRQALFSVLNEPPNRYLARQICYVLTVHGLETYLVLPRDTADFAVLVDALGSALRPADRHVLIGLRGPIAPPSLCNGLNLPVVGLDQLYVFDVDSLVGSLPKPESVDEAPFRAAAEELFERVMQVADNAGSSDEHRAMNYLAVRYPQIYAKTAEAFAEGQALTAIESRPSRLSGTRKILDVLLSYTDRSTDVTEKFFVRVDVTEEFPFLVTKLSPYYDR
ncbi:hypothetical protein ACQEVX_05180 [Streptomyces syringium]|uniref:cyanobactin maturation protease PatG family protein n=1 Tax=Streptomyces syringium TaxID=76729 RepID=UPI003D8A640D